MTTLRTKIGDGHRITDYKVNGPIKIVIIRIPVLFYSVGTTHKAIKNKHDEEVSIANMGADFVCSICGASYYGSPLLSTVLMLTC